MLIISNQGTDPVDIVTTAGETASIGAGGHISLELGNGFTVLPHGVTRAEPAVSPQQSQPSDVANFTVPGGVEFTEWGIRPFTIEGAQALDAAGFTRVLTEEDAAADLDGRERGLPTFVGSAEQVAAAEAFLAEMAANPKGGEIPAPKPAATDTIAPADTSDAAVVHADPETDEAA